MAGLMAAPLVLIELLLMGRMYENRQLNKAIAVVAVVAGMRSSVSSVTKRQ